MYEHTRSWENRVPWYSSAAERPLSSSHKQPVEAWLKRSRKQRNRDGAPNREGNSDADYRPA